MTRIRLKIFSLATALTAGGLTVGGTEPAADNTARGVVTQEATAPASAEGFTAAKVFKSLPVDVLEIVPEETRNEMVIYAEAGSDRKLLNALGGETYITRLTKDFAEVRVSPSSTLQIKILKLKKGKEIAMTIYTVGNEAQAADSDVSFFDEGLRPLKTDKYLREPDLAAFFSIPKGSLTSMKEIRSLIPYPTCLFEASAESDELKCTLTSIKYLGDDDRHIVELFDRGPVIYTWDGSRFRAAKTR